MLAIVAAHEELTIRHLFYLMVSQSLIEKTETEYNNVVIRLALQLRRSGDIPYGKIVDGTRLYRQPRLYDSVYEALSETARLYRRDYWRNADERIECWCEKEAISGFLFEVTRDLGVPLMVTRGFSSESVVQSVAEDVMADGRPLTILFVNDLDPSGNLMPADVMRRIKFYAPEAKVRLWRVAVTPAQVEEYSLPTRPTKRDGNSHAAMFEGDSVEVDAMPPDILKELLRSNIEGHMDPEQLRVLREAETSERNLLLDWARYTA
ncbi:MAG: hypothetical protein EOS52_19130 [Mesorhizobium sp.]|nr:MAG: hypothetical protein EOS52_19130 [Mesorhizobium sp.]